MRPKTVAYLSSLAAGLILALAAWRWSVLPGDFVCSMDNTEHQSSRLQTINARCDKTKTNDQAQTSRLLN